MMSSIGELQKTRMVIGTGRRKQLKPQRKTVDMEMEDQSEEDKIQEYMRRSDTAVIFPEPAEHADKSRTLKPKVYNEVESRLENSIKCAICTKSFTSTVALQNHMTTCTVMTSFLPSPPNTCLHCGTSFTSQEFLEKHELTHSPNTQVSCTICKKTFANVYRLQRHMISHDESIVLRKFKCPECGKAFKFKHHLKEHIRIHSGEKPFQCPNCGKRFSHSGSYSSHMTSKKCLTVGLKNGNRGRLPLEKPMPQLTSRKPNPAGKKLEFQEDVKIPSLSQAIAPPVFLNPPSYPNLHPMVVTPQYSSHYTPPELSPQLDIKPHPVDLQKNSPGSPFGVNGESKSDSCKSDDEEKPLVIDDKTEESNDGNELLNRPSHMSPGEKMTEPRNEVNGSDEDREGLALKLQVMVSGDEDIKCEVSSPDKQELKCEEVKTDGSECDSNRDENEEGGGRKVRVRSLISEEQLAVLKRHYNTNPRPKKDEIERIASEIRFSPRVVKVWFQNTRARDRREGKAIHIPFYSNMTKSSLGVKGFGSYSSVSSTPYQTMIPHYNGVSSRLPLSMLYNHGGPNYPTSPQSGNNDPPEVRPRPETDGPLDLSTKKSTPSSSPNPQCTSDCDNVKVSPAPSPSLSSRSSPSIKGLTFNNNIPVSDSPLYKYLPRESLPSIPPIPESYLKIHEDRSKIQNGSEVYIPRNDFATDLRDTDILIRRSPEGNSLTSHGEDMSIDRDIDDMSMGVPAKKRKLWKPCKPEDIEGHYTCDQCDKTFSKQSSLARHKYEHSGQRPHKCDVCNKAFKHKHHLTEHKRLHSGEKPFQCSKCLKRFSHSGSYSQHMNHRYSYCKPYRE